MTSLVEPAVDLGPHCVPSSRPNLAAATGELRGIWLPGGCDGAEPVDPTR